MKYGVLVTTTENGGWSVSQLKQEEKSGEFKRVPQAAVFIDHSFPNASVRLLDSIEKGLRGKITKPKNLNKSLF